MIEEVLGLTRNISAAIESSRPQSQPMRRLSQETLDHFLGAWRLLVKGVALSDDPKLAAVVMELRRPIGMMLRRIGASRTASAFHVVMATLEQEQFDAASDLGKAFRFKGIGGVPPDVEPEDK